VALNLTDMLSNPGDLAVRTPTAHAAGLEGSRILAIAAEVRALKAAGRAVSNFTIGDFDTSLFRAPELLVSALHAKLDAGEINYPPAIGIPELRAAVRSHYAERLGLEYPDGSVIVGAGARPPIFAAMQTLLAPGDKLVYPVPSWNVRYYAYLNRAEGVPVVTSPEDGFMPTAEALRPHLKDARVLLLNSPLNPCGTVIEPGLLGSLCEAILEENRRREVLGTRPLMLIYDQVYWQLVFDGHEHRTPVHMDPEMAKYTVLVDAVSKAWAATGLRVGWAVTPPWLRSRMAPLIGHMGAWASKFAQAATAELLADPPALDPHMTAFRGEVSDRLHQLRDGLLSLADDGVAVRALAPQGAIYLSAQFDLLGKTIAGRTLNTDDDIRALLLHEAGVAVVPFTAFGYPEGTGWVRFSVGAVSKRAIDDAVTRMREVLRAS
jgi:aspartate aminotransferase